MSICRFGTLFACIGLALSHNSASAVERTKEFEIRDGTSWLGGKPVKLWGLRCNNALMSPAVTERLINNLDEMAGHGINLIAVSFHGTNGGFPDVNAGPNAFTSDGRVIPGFARRLTWLCREADKRGMVVCLGMFMPRKDETLKDEAAIRKAIEQTAGLLESEGLGNVFVNMFQEYDHPLRIDHEIFREPDGPAKKARLAGWFKAVAPNVEIGMCPNHQSKSQVDYPGCDIQMFHEEMPIPAKGFALNTETPDRDASGNEGIFNKFHLKSLEAEWNVYLKNPNAAMLFRSPYVEDVTGKQGTGPNFEVGGKGTGESDRGIAPYYDWLKTNVGAWKYPVHVKADSPAE